MFFKERVKLGYPWLMLVLGSGVFAAYLSLRLRNVHQFHDAVSIWGAWIFKGYLFFSPYQYYPLAAGVLLGALQFLPETLNKRIRLVLHLPLGEERVVAHHLLAGILMLTMVFAPAIVLFEIAGRAYFPREFQPNLAFALGPWLLGGYAGYLLAATLLLESSWRHRIFYLLFGSAAIRLFYLGEFYDVYARVLLPLTLWVIALFVLPLFSSYRFRKSL